MSDVMFREYRAEDVSELIRLWTAVFGDKQSFAEKFFAALPDMGSGVVAVLEGKIVGAAYALTGQKLLEGEKSIVTGYIYGVGVYREYRGRKIGETLTQKAYLMSKERGAQIVATLPSEESLYPWYERAVGFKYTIFREKYMFSAAELESVMPLSSTEYMLWRENMLRDRPHMQLSNFSLEFEKKLLEEYGGGFYMAESGFLAAYLDDDTAIIVEALCPDRESALRSAAAAGYALGAKNCKLFLPAAEGEKYVLSDLPLPENCVWNLTFD